ncbi:YbaB/EbfC family nucleoid-associated protein [Patescibacteria group bacterium]|nr:YbaB/EbfC family nucleoid-associated protein [Patescibacteria group bacterium]
MIKQAKEVQGKLKKIKDELKHKTYTAESGGVTVIIDGEMVIKDVKVGPNANLQKVSGSFKDAANNALTAAKQDAAQKLQSVAGGLNLPGLT